MRSLCDSRPTSGIPPLPVIPGLPDLNSVWSARTGARAAADQCRRQLLSNVLGIVPPPFAGPLGAGQAARPAVPTPSVRLPWSMVIRPPA
jgi:hypothetical protein